MKCACLQIPTSECELTHLKTKFVTARNEWIDLLVCPEAYLEPIWASTTEFFLRKQLTAFR